MNTKISHLFVFFTALICIILPCLFIQGQYLVNGNISWLLIAAERLLDGQKLSEHIYETNPPLSILAYTPHILFAKALGMPITVGSFYLTFIFICLSTLTTYFVIKPFEFLSSAEKKVFILGYFLSVTLGTTVFFSEREHFVILSLVPFVLCQYAMARHINIRKAILIPVMVVGALCILVKPHYGLLPTIFILDRMIRQRKCSAFFNIDFIALSIMTLAYIGIIFTFFSDYVEIIFPDVLTLYATNTSPVTAILSIQTYMFACAAMCVLELFMEDLNRQKKSFIMFLYCCALLCLIPYFVQMKGFFNHITPIYTFFLCALTLSISFRVPYFFKSMKIAQIIIPITCLAFIIHVQTPLNTRFPKQTDIPNLPVAQFLEKECTKPCTFFAFHGDIEIINPTAAYMGYTHASRFPSLWFIPKILTGLKSTDKQERVLYQRLKNKYTQIVADDLEHYKPSVIMIVADLPIGTLKAFDFMGFFGKNQKLRHIIRTKYEKDEQFMFDRAQYFTGTTLEKSYLLKYDVYRRKASSP